MPPKSTWSPEAVRDLLLAMAMSEGGKKPTPNWGKVEAIMAEWGYGFTACGISKQHFNKKIWRHVVEKHGELGVASPAKTASPATPKKRGGRKKAKSQETAIDSDTDLSETPSKKRKVSAKKGPDDDEDDQYRLKKEVKKESI